MIPDFTIENGVLKSARKTLDCAIVPIGVTEIGESAFEGCECLISVTLPKSLIRIGEKAFYFCRNLETVTIPDGVKEIGDHAFCGTALSEVNIPDSVSTLGNSAFSRCSDLKKVTVGRGVKSIPSYAFYDDESLETVILGNGVTAIRDSAFEKCEKLSHLKVSSDLATVEEKAFSACPSFTVQMHFPSVASLFDKKRLFPDETKYNYYVNGSLLFSLTVPDGIETIPEKAFMRVMNLNELTIPASVKKIDRLAFFGCPSLTKVNLPESGIEIAECAFDNILLPPYPDDPECFTHCYQFTEKPSKDAITVEGVGSFEYQPFDSVKYRKLIDTCSEWKWESGYREYTDYNGTDYQCYQDGYPDYTMRYRKLYPCHCLLKDGAVIGFCLGKKVMLTSKPFEHKETSDCARFEHCKDYTWRLLKR